jgi:metal-dependent amidase/aminoacylase/carboxypeptidase family protein
MVRAKTIADLGEIQGRVMRCFEAGALATGATLSVVPISEPYAEVAHDDELCAVYQRNAEALGRFFPDPRAFGERGMGSTDMGNVSQALPSIHPVIGIDSLPAVNHQPEFAAQCVTPAADRAVGDGAVALAWTAIDLASEPRIRERLLRRARS